MILPRLLLIGTAISMLGAPAHAAEAESKPGKDPAIECGAFFILMAGQTEIAEEERVFADLGNHLLNDVDGRLERMGVSLAERERIGGEAVTRANERMTAGDIDITFADCHVAMESAIDALMPDILTDDARELLTCGSQFIYSLQSGDFDEATKADLEIAADDQMARAQSILEESGVTAEEQDQVSTFYGLSVGMVLGMGEEPIVEWQKCGEV